MGLSLMEYSDRELLNILIDLDPFNEGSSTEQISDQIGLVDRDRFRNVGARMSWMRRFGVVERNGDGLWRLTPAGDQVAHGGLRQSVLNTIDAIGDAGALELGAAIASRYQAVSYPASAMMRRSLQRGMKR